MSTAPAVDVDLGAFWNDPYPVLARLRADAPIAYVPQLGATVFTRRDDIVTCEKRIDVFSSHQPEGLMNRLMGLNLMRKDGDAHRRERLAMLPAMSPQVVKTHWLAQFRRHAAQTLESLRPLGGADICSQYAMPVSAEALKAMTGLSNITAAEMDAWSQAMIDGIANYAGTPDVAARCHAATASIDAAIDARLPDLERAPDPSLLSVFHASGMPMESVRANIKLTISGGQNEPRDAIAGTVFALLSHPQQLAAVRSGRATYLDAFEEYLRWISPIGMSPRRVATAHRYKGVDFEPNDGVFFLFGSANRDAAHFDRPECFDLTRDRSRSRHIAFGAGPHFCAGAAASRALVADVALPLFFAHLPEVSLDETRPARFGGWAFRGPLELRVKWNAA